MHVHNVAKCFSGPVTKIGDTALGLAVREGNLVVIKCLITECRIDFNGESEI